jgi:hypothetical protein
MNSCVIMPMGLVPSSRALETADVVVAADRQDEAIILRHEAERAQLRKGLPGTQPRAVESHSGAAGRRHDRHVNLAAADGAYRIHAAGAIPDGEPHARTREAAEFIAEPAHDPMQIGAAPVAHELQGDRTMDAGRSNLYSHGAMPTSIASPSMRSG